MSRTAPLSRSFLFVTSAVFLAGAPLLAAPAKEIKYSTVVLSGEQIPDLQGATFTDFTKHTRLAINARGDVLFDGVSSAGEGLWLHSNKPLATLAAGGGSYPSIGIFGALNDRGEVVFKRYSNAAVGVWAGAPGDLRLVASSTTQAPGLPAGSKFSDFGDWRGINASGDVYITNGELGSIHGDNEGLWIDSGAGLQPVALRGQPLPGTGQKPLLDFYRPEFNNRGEVAFHGVISVSQEPQDRGIWFGKAGSLIEVARLGKIAPGTGGGIYTELVTADINHRGEIAYSGRFGSAAAPYPGAKALWAGDPESPTLIATGNMTAPGTSSKYLSFNDPVINDAGEVGFYAYLDEPERPYGVFAGKPDQIRLILREGDRAPGTPDGVRFKTYPNDFVRLNADGQIAVRLFLAGPDVGTHNEQGILATDHSGDIRLVAREGDPFTVAEGDVRIIEEIGFRWDMNASGQVAFSAAFTDGSSGVFVANVFPEPTGILALAAGAVLLRRAPRRRRLA